MREWNFANSTIWQLRDLPKMALRRWAMDDASRIRVVTAATSSHSLRFDREVSGAASPAESR